MFWRQTILWRHFLWLFHCQKLFFESCEILEKVVVIQWKVQWVCCMMKFCRPICSTSRALALRCVKHCCVKRLDLFFVAQCWIHMLQFLMHFINFMMILLCSDCFTRIQKAVNHQSVTITFSWYNFSFEII